MTLINTDAVVLRTYNLAEADRIVLCLTRSSGLVRAVAKGARRMKSRFGAAFEPFTLIRLAFHEKENRELVAVSSAEIIRSNFAVATQPEVADVLAYIAELISEFAPPHEANEKLFRMVVACVDALAETPETARLVLRYFEVWLLRLAGLFPELQECAECGRNFTEADQIFLTFDGKPCCHSCSHGYDTKLLPQTRQTLIESRRLAPAQFVATFRATSVDSQTEFAEFTQRLIVRALERRPRTLVATS
jgi:DNA repair protein RecO (recombination protein O)